MSKVLLDLEVIQIYWYSACIVVGMAFGMYFVYREAKRRKISENTMTDIIFYTIVISILGARLYYVAFEWSYFSKHLLEILEIWNGGLAIHGAIIFGGLFLILYSKKKRIDTLMLLDVCCVGLIIGQAIGRWGNFFNQEVYGGAVSLEHLKSLFIPGFIIDGMYIGGEYHQPLFLYESIWNLIGFGLLLFIRRRKYIKTGQIFGLYCVWYGTARLIMEGMREEQYNLMLGNFKVAQLVSIGMIVVGLFFFIRRFRGSRFDHLYNNDIVIKTDETSFKKPTSKVSFIPGEKPQTPPSPPTDPGLDFNNGAILNEPSSMTPISLAPMPTPTTEAPLNMAPVPEIPTNPPVEVPTEAPTNAPVTLGPPTMEMPTEVVTEPQTPVTLGPPTMEMPTEAQVVEAQQAPVTLAPQPQVEVQTPVTEAPVLQAPVIEPQAQSIISAPTMEAPQPEIPQAPIMEPQVSAPILDPNQLPSVDTAPPSGNKFII